MARRASAVECEIGEMVAAKLRVPRLGAWPSFIYYCSFCEKVLIVAPKLVDPGEVRRAFRWRCPGCGFSLEQFLSCTKIENSSFSGPSVHPTCREPWILFPDAKKSLRTSFCYADSPSPASSKDMGLTSGLKALDSLLGELQPSWLTVFYGSRYCDELAHLLCVRAQLPRRKGGLGSHAVFIDGGNAFDPYLVASAARRYALHPEEALGKIHVSRAFTCYQLYSLILDGIPEALHSFDLKFVVVSEMLRLYSESGLERTEVRTMFNRVAYSLRELAEEHGVLVLATYCSKKKSYLDRLLLSRANIVARFQTVSRAVRLTLERHPEKPRGFAGDESLLGSEHFLDEFLSG
ncbi:MAG: hypothetical protein OEY99_01360 [Aigarchaeota archaeon]|nr:hypothetical protein [Aigarchaeota archaeon]